jgi:hypothetical protein
MVNPVCYILCIVDKLMRQPVYIKMVETRTDLGKNPLLLEISHLGDHLLHVKLHSVGHGEKPLSVEGWEEAMETKGVGKRELGG